jgi:hypothetical protein
VDLPALVVMAALQQAEQDQELLEQAARLAAVGEQAAEGDFQRLLRQLLVEQAE